MKKTTHSDQQKIWDKEHNSPQVLLQMDSTDPSSGVVKFWQWLQEKGNASDSLNGLEMGCGKGRSVIWLAQQGVRMTGFDFSPTAIKIALDRAKKAGVENLCKFFVQDATVAWKLQASSFDFAVDCFATTDIESSKGRRFAVSEMIRIVKPHGYIFVYVMSTDDEFHKQMIAESPASEKNAFIHSTGKFEKVFDRQELLELYNGLKVIVEERVPKIAIFFGKEYKCNHHWIVFEKV